ncbi:hypothetical protein SAMN05216577_11120 [Pseudomonas citronellolis]|uniref:Uncharacterized protein n=1 Tax=Pseudomonas citronellolis TaxID=53408 RepID=A0AAQ1KFN3_9PSED|nr:hypothetical protein SAMN05216577_11120 [Pseudomonas citronellolis]
MSIACVGGCEGGYGRQNCWPFKANPGRTGSRPRFPGPVRPGVTRCGTRLWQGSGTLFFLSPGFFLKRGEGARPGSGVGGGPGSLTLALSRRERGLVWQKVGRRSYRWRLVPSPQPSPGGRGGSPAWPVTPALRLLPFSSLSRLRERVGERGSLLFRPTTPAPPSRSSTYWYSPAARTAVPPSPPRYRHAGPCAGPGRFPGRWRRSRRRGPVAR